MDDYMVSMRDFCLPSELRVVLQEDRVQPLVSVTTLVDGGFAGDPKGQEGTAHLAEHLWFRTLHGGADTWAVLEGAGASFNAVTEAETTQFMVTAPRAALPVLLALEADRLGAGLASITPADVDIERNIVKNERILGTRPASEAVRAVLPAQLFPCPP